MPGRPGEILLIEDRPITARLVRAMLTSSSAGEFEFRHVERLSDAFHRLRECKASCVLLDLSLPDASGLEAIIRIREADSTVPIVVLTAHEDEGLALQAMREGAQDYLVKGQVDSNLLNRSIRYAIERKTTELRIRQSEERLRLILETAHEAFISIDAEGSITAWNSQAETIFGWSRAEVLGRRLVTTIIPARHRRAYLRRLRRFIETGDGRVLGKLIELGALHREGHEFPAELTISPLKIGDRYVFNIFLRDITERRRSQAYLAAQHAVTKVLAQSWTLEETTSRLLEALGESIGWKVGALWTVDEEAGLLRCESSWHTPNFSGKEFEARTRELTFSRGSGLPGRVWKSGSLAWIEDVANDPTSPRAAFALKEGLHSAIGLPLISGRETVSVMEFFSSEVGSPDAELVQMMTTISTQVGQFIERTQAEREAERAKDEFFATVSHELRTPLTSIKGYAELMLGSLVEAGLEQERSYLEVIRRNTGRLERLVEDVLFVARLGAGEFECQARPLDLRELIAGCVEAAQPKAGEKQIELTFKGHEVVQVRGDEDRLAQLIDNLISNALKYTPDGGRVGVRVHGGNQAVVMVEDSGIGIPLAEQEQLFDRFFRGSSAEHQVIPGVGLGLTIAKGIVDSHGGQISVESGGSAGSTFSVELPLEEA